MRRFLILSSLTAGLVLAIADTASAGLFRRSRCTTPTYYVVPCVPCPPPAPADTLTADEQAQLDEMLEAGWLKPEQVDAYKSATADERQSLYEEFAQAAAPPQPTAEELAQWLEMVKAGKKNGGFDAADLPTYQAAAPAERKQVYEEFKKFVPPPSAEELSLWLEMVKAGKKDGGFAAEDLPVFQKASPAQRKKMYEDFKANKSGSNP